MIKNIKEFTTPKQTKNPYLKSTMGVLVKKDRIVATDTFKLIEVKVNSGVSEDKVIELPKGIKSLHSLKDNNIAYADSRGKTFFAEEIKLPYPQYEEVFNRLENKEKISVRISASHLQSIAKAFTGDEDYVDMFIYPDSATNPIKFSRNDITALLMPIIK